MGTPRNQIERNRRAEAEALLREGEDKLARKAYELRRSGKSWWQIAEEMKLPEARVSELCHQAIKHAATLVSNATKMDMLMMEVDILTDAIRAVYPDAMDGDTRSIDSLVKIVMSRAKLLGLDNMVETSNVRAVVVQGSLYEEALRQITSGNAT